MFRLIVLAISLLLLSFYSHSAFAVTNRVALVIGNDDYDNIRSLRKAKNDARAMARMLRSLNFDVIHRENVTLSEMRDIGNEFYRKLKKGDIAFIFFAGHGANMRGANQYLPIDIPAPNDIRNASDKLREEKRLVSNALSESFFIDLIKDADAKIGIMVFDACRDNPLRIVEEDNNLRNLFPGDIVFGNERGLVRISNPPKGFYTLYSAGHGETALDQLRNTPDNDPNSPFTRVLIKNMAIENLDFHAVAKQTQATVVALAESDNHTQTPSIYEQIIGDPIYLNGHAIQTTARTVEDEFVEPANNQSPARDNWMLSLYEGLDFWGNDIENGNFGTDDPEQCARACASDRQCTHFIYNRKQEHCFLKDGYDFAVRTPDVLGGFIHPKAPVNFGQNQTPKFNVSWLNTPKKEYTGPALPWNQMGGNISTIDACLKACNRIGGDCNYLTFYGNKRGSKRCMVRKNFYISTRYNPNASIYERIYEIAEPTSGPFELGPELTASR